MTKNGLKMTEAYAVLVLILLLYSETRTIKKNFVSEHVTISFCFSDDVKSFLNIPKRTHEGSRRRYSFRNCFVFRKELIGIVRIDYPACV